MTKKFAIVLALFVISIVCCAGCIGPGDNEDPEIPDVPDVPDVPDTPVDPVDPVVPVEEYSVMFMLNYGDAGAYTAETVKAGETVSKPANPTRSGYTFKGWFTAAEGGAEYDFTQAVNADVTLYAQWKKKSSSSSGGSSAPSHTHSYTTLVETIDPTCTEGGHTVYKCSCGDTENRDYIEATGHSNAFKTEDGKNIIYCSICTVVLESENVPDYVAQVEDEFYTLFSEALDNATTKGKDLVLLVDTEEDINVDVTIDTNGKVAKLIYTNVNYIKIRANTATDKDNVTLIDNSISKKIAFNTEANGDGCLVVKSATSESSKILDIYTLDGLKDFRDNVNSGNEYSSWTVTLMDDINLVDVTNWEPIGKTTVENGAVTDHKFFKGIFDGNEKTIYNLKVDAVEDIGLFGYIAGGTVKNLKVETAILTGNHCAGVIAGTIGYGSTIEGCEVEGVTITLTPNKVENSYDNGDDAGAIVGIVNGYQSVTSILKDCKAENVVITAYRDIGGIVGTINTKVSSNPDVYGVINVENCDVTGISLTSDQSGDNSYGYKEACLGKIIGRYEGDLTATYFTETENDVSGDVSLLSVWSGDVPTSQPKASALELIPATTKNQGGTIIVKDAGALAYLNTLSSQDWSVLVGNPDDHNNYYYKWEWGIKLVVDIDLKNKPWTPISTGFATGDAGEGAFDGQGHTISNLVVSSQGDNVGLFTNVEDVKNLVIKNAKVTGYQKVGVIAGSSNGELTDITVENIEVTGNKYVGGIIGKGSCNFEDCVVSGTKNKITCTDGNDHKEVGGICGFFTTDPSSISVTNCHVNNAVITGPEEVGGILGRAYAMNTATITLTGCTVSNVQVVATDTTTTYKGDIIGRDYDSTGVTIQ